ncbi:hypothetical protein QOZ80_2AG0137810 [Eleusine coracana subsp. coracana]|nr:hypothetical protein QOZ80_2AG0137810 [Eleusine coracana subsp. coracana]
MQAPRGGGFLGKRKRHHGYYPQSSTWSYQQASRIAPPPPPPPPRFFANPDPRMRFSKQPGRPAVVRPGPKPPAPPPPADAAECAAGTKLLAGYLAHEYLTYGTLLGKPMLPPPPIQKEKHHAAAAPASSGATAPPPPKPAERCAEVSRLIMAGGAHIPGIVNPSQLGGWLGIKK